MTDHSHGGMITDKDILLEIRQDIRDWRTECQNCRNNIHNRITGVEVKVANQTGWLSGISVAAGMFGAVVKSVLFGK